MSKNSTKRKVLIFSMAFYPKPVGGAEVAIKEITDRLSPEVYEFHLISLRYDSTVPKEEHLGNIHVHRIGFTKRAASTEDCRRLPLHLNKLLYQCMAAYRAWRLHRQYHFDLVWGVMAHSSGVPSALFKRFFPKVGYVLTLQEGDPPHAIESKMRFFGPLFKRAFTTADVVQTISVFLADWAQRMGYKKEPVVIPNGVNVSAFTDVPEADVELVIHEIGKKAGETWLIHTGRYAHKNALDVVIRALTQLPDTVHALLIGEGPEREKLRATAATHGVSDRVHFHAYVDARKLPAYLKASDIFIRPSRSEGMGNSFVEAMAAGIPVIATQVGGIRDFLFDATRDPNKLATGWAVDVDDPAGVAAAVQTILSEKEHTAEIVARAQKMVVEQYDWDLVAQRMQTEVFEPALRERH